MLPKTFSAAAVALAASTFVSAQTFTDCDPTKEDCPNAPALGANVLVDFTKGNGDDYLYSLDGTKVTYDDELGAVFSISKDTEAPTKASHKYIFFGEVECTVQAAPGVGIVTSIVLEADDLDEIDWEWVGGDNYNVQTNYFSKGDTTTYDRGGIHPVENPTGQFHKYGIVWTKEKIDWTIDGHVIRTVTYEDAKGGKEFPQAPMQVKLGTWTAGREGASQGTVDWAGGVADFSKGPFVGYYRDCRMVDYAGGVEGAVEYKYGDRSGTWESVIVITEDGETEPVRPTTTRTTATSTTSTKTSTSAPASTSSAASSSEAESSAEPSSSASKASSSAESTMVTSVVSSSAAASSAAESSVAVSPTIPADTAAVEQPSAVVSEEPSAGMTTRANLALGIAGLFLAYMF
ncbi:glycoside hydrolase family 16 protein, partial [Sodiomyces alcalophilus JCM 7366]|uniref:glycoside hydrolase family 16 protein n=1 Tax=Sodiomyces alcalophilus JCM 7366 TaxID=591952 RepID=UPI0039B568A7